MEQQVQQLTQMLDGMATRVEEQTQRIAHAEQQTGAAATEAANARSETQALHARMQSNTESMPAILTALTDAVKNQKRQQRSPWLEEEVRELHSWKLWRDLQSGLQLGHGKRSGRHRGNVERRVWRWKRA